MMSTIWSLEMHFSINPCHQVLQRIIYSSFPIIREYTRIIPINALDLSAHLISTSATFLVRNNRGTRSSSELCESNHSGPVQNFRAFVRTNHISKVCPICGDEPLVNGSSCLSVNQPIIFYPFPTCQAILFVSYFHRCKKRFQKSFER